MEKVLITGVYGKIGREILSSLNSYYNIIGIGKSNKFNLCDNYIKCDMTDYNSLEEVIKNNLDITIIVHCAAMTNSKKQKRKLSLKGLIEANYTATVNLVDLCNKHLQVKTFIFMSSISVYGEQADKNIYSEDDLCYPISHYAVSKKMAEAYIQENCTFNYYILRLSPVYDNKSFTNLSNTQKSKGVQFIVGKGSNRLSMCNVLNIVDVVSHIIQNNNEVPSNNIYNISDLKPYKFSEIIQVTSKAKRRIFLPLFLIKAVYCLKIIFPKSYFFNDKLIKHIKDHIYPSEKISKYMCLNYSLENTSVKCSNAKLLITSRRES